MATPAVITALDLLEARFGNISIANGYNNDIAIIARAGRTPPRTGDLPSIDYWDAGVETTERNYNRHTKQLSIVIVAYALTRDYPFVDVAAKLAADIETAIFRDVLAPEYNDDHSSIMDGQIMIRWNGYAPSIGEGGAPWCGAITEIDLTFETPPGDPYTLLYCE